MIDVSPTDTTKNKEKVTGSTQAEDEEKMKIMKLRNDYNCKQ